MQTSLKVTKGSGGGLLMLGCRPNTHITLFWLEMKHHFLQIHTVLERSVGNTSISNLHTLRLLGTLLQKSAFFLLLSNMDMEKSLLFPLPYLLKTLHESYSIYLFSGRQPEKKKKQKNPIILFQKYPSLWIGLCCNPFWIYPRSACLLGCNDNVLDGLQGWVEGVDHRQSMIQPRFLSHLWISQPLGKKPVHRLGFVYLQSTCLPELLLLMKSWTLVCDDLGALLLWGFSLCATTDAALLIFHTTLPL